MKAIEISSYGPPDVLRLVDVAAPVLKNAADVLIDVKAAGINRPDIFQRMGKYSPPAGASLIPGLEVSGVVRAVGEGVRSVAVGDKVCALLTGGGYAEQCIAPAATCLPVPVGLSFEEAASLPETFFTAWSNVFDRAKLKAGETILVHGGSSGIGVATIQLAKAFGAYVYTTVGSDEKSTFCETLGADKVIHYKEQDFVEEILKYTNGKGVDVILDMVGGSYISRNIKCLAFDGRHVSIAFLQGSKVEFNMLPIMVRRLTLTGSTLRARSTEFKALIASALKEKVWPLLEMGVIRPFVYETFSLSDAVKAHQMMEEGRHMGKIILRTG